MKSLSSLNRLVDLRALEVDRLQAEMAAKEAVRQRYRGNLERLDAFYADSGASGALSPSLALNCGAYKQAVLGLAATHRESLVLHEADMAVTQRALSAAACRHEVLGMVVARQQARQQQAGEVRERKRQDELAMQVWSRASR